MSAEVKLRAGIDGAFILPVGTWGDRSGLGFGGLGEIEYVVQNDLTTSFRIGYLYHLSKDRYSTSELPIMVGTRYYFLGGHQAGGLFSTLEIGATRLTRKSDNQGYPYSDSSFTFGTMIGAGYDWYGIEVCAHLYVPDLGHFGDFMGVVATIGYTWDFTM